MEKDFRIGSVLRGLQSFSRTESGYLNPAGEAVWLARKAVEQDKRLRGIKDTKPLRDVKMYAHRLREMGSIFAEIFAFQEYEWQPKRKDPKIFDFGSDIGGFTVLYWKSVAPFAQVTLVEANPSTATVVAESIKRRKISGVKVINAAISGEEGKVDLNLSGYNPSNFVGKRSLDKADYHTVTVPAIKASNLIGDEKVDLLKMDVEGMEGTVLKDLAETGRLSQINQIMMEFHNSPYIPNNSLKDVLRILTAEGFLINNVHISGIDRVLHNRPIDINSIRATDEILFSFICNRPGNSQ